MPLYQVQTGFTINSADLNQLVNILQRQPGQQETGKYYLTQSATGPAQSFGEYVNSLSRVSIPTGSVALDTTDKAPTSCATPTADHQSASGFRVFTTSTQSASDCEVAGNYTIFF